MTTPTAVEQFDRPADPVLTSKIVTHLKSQGIFDQFRRECMADVDTKPAYQNLRQRVEGSVAAFLKMNPWRPDMNKNQLRDNLRKHIQSGGFLDIGVDRIVDQVVNPKIYTVFLPKVEEVVHNCLGMDKGKPVFEPPPTPEVKNEPPPRFQNKHNLAPRARIPASLSGPRFPLIPNAESMKPPESLEDKDPTEEGKVQSSSPEQEETTNRNYVVDEEDNEENPEDDEESPPFEPHSESDRLILGVRTDSSDSVSNDSQVVTTIVDDNLEDRIDSSGTAIKVEGGDKEVKKEDEYSSDEYVPKTPTINLEGSDGNVIEFNSISEYKQYQTKYDEESLQNVEEEVVSSQWLDDSSNPIKEERNSEESEDISLKRKLNIDHFDEASSSSVGKGSTSDEGKPGTYINFVHKKMKVEEDDQDYETVSEFNINENEDSNPEKSKYMVGFNMKISDSEQREKYKKSEGSKESGKSHRHHHATKDHRSSSHQSTSSKDKSSEKEYRESSSSSTHSSKDKKDHHKRDDKQSQSRDRNKEKERKKSESSATKHSDRDRSKYDDKDKEKNMDKRKVLKSETDNKDQENTEKDKKEHRDKSRDHNEKEKRKHDNHDKHSDGKQDHDSSYRHDKDKRDSVKSSKHSHSSSRHSHKSSERYKSDKDQKIRQPSDKHTSYDKKSEKHDSRKKSREHCKPSNRDNEGRRSTDRDSNGPSGRSQSSSHSSCTSRSATSRSHNESTAGNGDRTASNSDNAVSDNVEKLIDEDVISEPGIASPDPEPYEDSWSEHYVSSGSEFYDSKGEMMETSFESNEKICQNVEEISGIQHIRIEDSHQEISDGCDVNHTFDLSQAEHYEIHQKEHSKMTNDYDKCDNMTDDVLQNLEENICVEKDDMEESFTNPTCSVHDTSSEKENIEQTVNYKEKRNSINELSKSVDQKEAKFKKPKIAANIFEVKKIMQARRNLKRMEKKRLKLLTNNNPDICITEKTAYENCIGKPPDENFIGFENVTCHKTEMYDYLIKRLSNEIDLLTVKEEINPNLVTSLIEVKPELDEYIENVLKGKVHRKLRVRLPPISHEYYTFDIEQNAYILSKCREYSSTPCEELVDGNLNNLNKVSQNRKHFVTSSGSEFNHASDTFNGSTHKLKYNAIKKNVISKPVVHNVNESHIIVEEESNSLESSFVSDMVSSEEESSSPENSFVTGKASAEMASTHANVITSTNVASAIEIPSLPKVGGFVLTFNQTYDEILKERQQTLVETVEAVQECQPTPRTVVKITNSDTTEKVVMKKVSANLQNKSQVPRITKSETVVNGMSAKSTTERKLPPLISRIKKCNRGLVSPPSTKQVNGIISVDDVCKVYKTNEIPEQQINDVIGITTTVMKDQDYQRNPLEVDCEDQRHLRDTKQVGSRVQQRYNSSDLYKPRLQLSRRGRGKSSPVDTAISQAIITRKRPAVTIEESSRPKRKR